MKYPLFAVLIAVSVASYAPTALADAHIRVVSAPPSAEALAKPVCAAQVSAGAIGSAQELDVCDADVLNPHMPGDNFGLTFVLRQAYAGLVSAGPTTLELTIRRGDFEQRRFGAFDIQLPASVDAEGVTDTLHTRMDAACSGGAQAPEQLWQSALWAYLLLQQTAPGLAVHTSYRGGLERLLYVSCRSLIAEDRTSATVAASIRDGGLVICPGRLRTTFAASDNFGPDCRANAAQASEPALRTIAEGARQSLLNESITGLQTRIAAQATISERDIARAQRLADALVLERRTGSLPSAAYLDLDRSMVSLLGDVARIQAASTAALPQGAQLTTPDIERTRNIGATLTDFRQHSLLPRRDFTISAQAVVDLYEQTARTHTQILTSGADEDGRQLAQAISNDYRDFRRQSGLGATALQGANMSVRAMENAASNEPN